LSPKDYIVEWICALPSKLTAAILVLDEEHDHVVKHPRDDNMSRLGVGFRAQRCNFLPSGWSHR
ncbi:uncharacterized protein A1O9_03801, partial [Exophiala aquamarina CBS 119918]